MRRERRKGSSRGYVLHASEWRESSLLLHAFTEEAGRIWLVAKGARRPQSQLRSVLLTFQPLWLRWSGAGEALTLTAAEWLGGIPMLKGEALWCGYYLNELILALAPREVAYPLWFAAYEETLAALAQGAAVAPWLRRFEWITLVATGHAPAGDEAGLGPAPLSPQARAAILAESWDAEVIEEELRPWLRQAMDALLGGRELKSRAFMRSWRDWEKEPLR